MMIKKIVFVSLVLIFAADIFNIALVHAANRVALVIGNSKYISSPLKNPANDAIDIASQLKSLGFDVVLRTDANKKSMVNALNIFGKNFQGLK